MASRDRYKDLSKAWGSKEKKADSRSAKSSLKRLTREEQQELLVSRDPELRRLGEDEISTPYQLVEGPTRRR